MLCWCVSCFTCFVCVCVLVSVNVFCDFFCYQWTSSNQIQKFFSIPALNIHTLTHTLYTLTTYVHVMDSLQQMSIVEFPQNWWHRSTTHKLLRLQFQPSNREFNRKICAVQCEGGGGGSRASAVVIRAICLTSDFSKKKILIKFCSVCGFKVEKTHTHKLWGNRIEKIVLCARYMLAVS